MKFKWDLADTIRVVIAMFFLLSALFGTLISRIGILIFIAVWGTRTVIIVKDVKRKIKISVFYLVYIIVYIFLLIYCR